MSCKHLARLSVLLAVFMALLLPTADAGKGGGSTPLTLTLYDSVVDEQDTTAFYNNGTAFCSGGFLQNSEFQGDRQVTGSSTAYDFGGWTSTAGLVSLVSTEYAHNADCDSATNICLRVQFDSNNKTLTFDTRGTSGPRTVTVSFAQPCNLTGCPGPAGNPEVFGDGNLSTTADQSLTTTGLLNVFLDFPYTSMAVCSSTTCPEAQPAFAKFWFTDPNDSSVTWRIDWQFLRVLRMSTNTWYLIADDCDGSQVAGLSKLQGSRTRPKTVFNGFYLIPFFVSGKLQ